MSAIYSITRDEVIKAAMQLCQALGQGESPTSTDITDSLPFIQSLLKYWEKEGYNAWLYQEFNFPAVAAKISYTLGPAGDVIMDRPVRIPQAWTQDSSGNRMPLIPLTMADFKMLTPNNAPGPANNFMYDRQLTAGVFWPWPVPTDATRSFYCIAQRPISDLAASGSATFDIEQSWYLPLIWNVADQIKLLFGTPNDVKQEIKQTAATMLAQISEFTQEEGEVRFSPSARMGGNRGRG